MKFGGSVLTGPKAVRRAADLVKREVEAGWRVAVVVSAMKGHTDMLTKMFEEASSSKLRGELDYVLASGEELSARLFHSALRSLGVSSVLVDPKSEWWPIFTDEQHGDAEPILEECSTAIREKILPLLESGHTPVICGFLGVSKSGKVTTMGRGGGDVTAVLLARFLGCREVVLVKDVEGVYTADPKTVHGAKVLDSIELSEVELLASSGARVVAPKALRYMPSWMKIRIVGFREPLTKGGTVVNGGADLEVSAYSRPLSMLTVVGEDGGRLVKLAEQLMSEIGCRTLASTSMETAAILYFEGSSEEAVRRVHKLVEEGEAKAVSGLSGLALVSVRGRGLETTPGVIRRVVEPISAAGVNIYGLFTIHSSVRVLVPWGSRDHVVELLERELRGDGGE
ncbi:MAG: hypothetical protein DRN96_08740 [Thermoproteota archaeon]|nr:MAG: hypothetical protein DRN96_08740 [Candidatus Korarchaeota archaeon]RLG53379.1 MAG: hypothetical protein DRN99_06805 [Candidatus Korarchaeota archaeon]